MHNEETTEPIPRYVMNWAQFKEHLSQKRADESPNESIYRGQCSSCWSLRPSLQRLSPGMTQDRYLSSILPEAYRLIAGYLDSDLDLANASERNRFLGILQHHGFPTPLLDWTRSPYIAAYFAFSDLTFHAPTEEYVTVWMLGATFTLQYLAGNGCAVPYELLTPHHRHNSRLLAQDGLFTRLLSNEPLDQTLGAAMKKLEHPGLLQRFDIPVLEARRALADLALMGLHPGTLFPGIDGACQWLRQSFFMEHTFLCSPKMQESISAAVSRLRADTE